MDSPPRPFPQPLLFGIFILSGISALIYQLVWQRSLLLIYGSNVESVAMVVAAFLCGLGVGSLVGGWLSERLRISLVVVFGLAELCIGGYGLLSLSMFELVGSWTVGVGTLMTGVLAFTLVFIPTMLMGSTLPLLLAHQVRHSGDVGLSVSGLYFVNTLGAAIGAFVAARWVLGTCGLSGSVRLAALLNLCAALSILGTAALRKRSSDL